MKPQSSCRWPPTAVLRRRAARKPKREDADLVTNRKKDTYRWQASVRSDDVPPGMRRLGDLRLQCQVGIAIAKKETPFLLRTLVATKLRTTDWCSAVELKMSTYSDPAIASATLLDGGRRASRCR